MGPHQLLESKCQSWLAELIKYAWLWNETLLPKVNHCDVKTQMSEPVQLCFNPCWMQSLKQWQLCTPKIHPALAFSSMGEECPWNFFNFCSSGTYTDFFSPTAPKQPWEGQGIINDTTENWGLVGDHQGTITWPWGLKQRVSQLNLKKFPHHWGWEILGQFYFSL